MAVLDLAEDIPRPASPFSLRWAFRQCQEIYNERFSTRRYLFQ